MKLSIDPSSHYLELFRGVPVPLHLCAVRMGTNILHRGAPVSWCLSLESPGRARQGTFPPHCEFLRPLARRASSSQAAKAQDVCQNMGAEPRERETNELFMPRTENAAVFLPFIQCSAL